MGRRLGLTAILVLGLAPVSAAAVTCDDSEGVWEFAPLLLAWDELPTNSLLWLRLDAVYEPNLPPEWSATLEGPEGGVDLTQELEIRSGDSRMIGLRPAQELDPNEDYLLTWSFLDRWDEATTDVERAFTTGDGPDPSTPPVPEERRRLLRSDADSLPSLCSSGRHYDRVEFEVTESGDIHLLREGSESAPSGDVWEVAALARGTTLAFVDDIGPARKVEVRFGAITFNGEFSGWSEPTTATMPLAGCTSSRAAVLFLLVPALAGLRLRRS